MLTCCCGCGSAQAGIRKQHVASCLLLLWARATLNQGAGHPNGKRPRFGKSDDISPRFDFDFIHSQEGSQGNHRRPEQELARYRIQFNLEAVRFFRMEA